MVRFFTIFLFLLILSCQKTEEKTKVVKIETKDPIEVIQDRIAQIVRETSPSVVTILSKSADSKTPLIFKFNEEIPPFENESLGSGFVIKKDKKYLYIVTNSHVIEKAKIITVKFSNGIKVEAKIAGKDSKSDIAVLKVPMIPKLSKINPLPIGDPSTLKVGYFVISAGSPYNLGLTFTLGIVSALNRNLGISSYENYIQTDAAINPGDSGGPLIDINGKVVGMNTAIIQTGQGLGFAIPINTVIEISKQLIAYGKVKRGWLGVIVQEIPLKVKKKLEIENGVQVIKVQKNSPAENAGIKTGDIIVSLNDQKIYTPSQLKNIILKLSPGNEIKLEIIRGNKRKTLRIKIKELVDNK